MLKFIKDRMQAALDSRILAEKQFSDAEIEFRTYMDVAVRQFRERFEAEKYNIADVTYRIEQFRVDDSQVVGIRLTIHRLQGADGKYYETALRTMQQFDENFKAMGMRNWSTENFDNNSRITTIVYL
ncbi:hypothetical protein D3C87_952990 [compost metagenome]